MDLILIIRWGVSTLLVVYGLFAMFVNMWLLVTNSRHYKRFGESKTSASPAMIPSLLLVFPGLMMLPALDNMWGSRAALILIVCLLDFTFIHMIHYLMFPSRYS